MPGGAHHGHGPTAKFGTVLLIVDQPASIGALPLTVARDVGCKVAYLPGLAMRRIADLYPGEAKTDERDPGVRAYVATARETSQPGAAASPGPPTGDTA